MGFPRLRGEVATVALEDKLVEWDGKSAEFLRDVYERSVDGDHFLDDLFPLLNETKFQSAATWLLKRHLDEGHSISGTQKAALFRSLKTLDDWESKLHALQCLPHLSITRGQAKRMAVFLRDCLQEKNKFVRAWAYGGFHVLSEQHEDYREEATERIAWAIEHESPSIRARIRQVRRTC